ncbi:MAG: hypothetical protein GX791_04030 [Synergistaceae bacterium]|nr:hypothetical protein [Synergistaceae bacterium]
MKQNMGWLLKRFFYFTVILAVAAGTVKVYFLWWEHQMLLNPEVVSAVPYTHAERIPVRGILIWREAIVSSKWSGRVTYPSLQPRRVRKGETLAVVESSKGKMAIQAEDMGYFLPALDGAEGKWAYKDFWNDLSPLPRAPLAEFFPQGRTVERGQAVGKLIPQPQDLRCVLYADVAPSHEQDIRRGFVRLKRKDLGWPQKVDVRVSRFHGRTVKLYVTLPFFPAEIIQSRELDLLLESEEKTGISVPETAVIHQEGKQGVLQVEGNMVRFQEIRGMPVEQGRFFVTSGLTPGNLVVRSAQSAREGKIQIW